MAEPLYILGAGSMGLLLAARLAPVANVVLIRRPGCYPAQRELILQEGNTQQRQLLAQAEAATLPTLAQRVIVCTKAYDALPALQQLGERLPATASLLLMQNGMSSQEEILRAFPQATVYAASSTEGAYRPTPDSVVHAGRGSTHIGRLQGAEEDWVSLLQSAGLSSEPAEPIRWHLANKLRVNALINPLTVLHDCHNGELLERPAVLAAMRRLGEEADTVLSAAGYRFDDSAFAQACEVAQRTASNISSMLQDARAGRRLEIDAITGYLLQLAEHHHISAPEHQAVHAQLTAREK